MRYLLLLLSTAVIVVSLFIYHAIVFYESINHAMKKSQQVKNKAT